MISTNLKNKEEIESAQVMKGISRLSSSCNIMEQMEALLLVLINKKQMAGDSVREVINCEKARQLFEELCAKAKAVGLERITPNYIYFNVCWNKQML